MQHPPVGAVPVASAIRLYQTAGPRPTRLHEVCRSAREMRPLARIAAWPWARVGRRSPSRMVWAGSPSTEARVLVKPRDGRVGRDAFCRATGAGTAALRAGAELVF